MSMENHGGMIDMGKLLIRPPELSGSPIVRAISYKIRSLMKDKVNFAFEASLFIFRSYF
jgi:hypothetical protein